MWKESTGITQLTVSGGIENEKQNTDARNMLSMGRHR